MQMVSEIPYANGMRDSLSIYIINLYIYIVFVYNIHYILFIISQNAFVHYY